MWSRFPAILAAFAALALAAGAEPPKPEARVTPGPARDAETQIACVVRVLTVRDDLFERAGIDVRTTVVLTDAQLRTLLGVVQGERLSNVMQCPKVTLFDGQEAAVRATQTESFVTGLEATRVKGELVLVPKKTTVETGTTLTLCAKASADRRAVGVRVSYSDARTEGAAEVIPVTTPITPVSEGGARGKPVPFTQYLQIPKIETLTIETADLTIASGGHAILPGPARVQDERREFGPPVLSKVPYVNRMFKNAGIGRTTVRAYLIVSPLVLEVPAVPAPGR